MLSFLGCRIFNHPEICSGDQSRNSLLAMMFAAICIFTISRFIDRELGDHKRDCHTNAKLAWMPDYLEMKNEFIAQSDGADPGSEVRTASYRIEGLR
jgi:hypothetical protein